MTNSMVSPGTHANGSVQHKFYVVERMGHVGSTTTVTGVATLDNGKSYCADTHAHGIQLQMDAASIIRAVYSVTSDHTTESHTT